MFFSNGLVLFNTQFDPFYAYFLNKFCVRRSLYQAYNQQVSNIRNLDQWQGSIKIKEGSLGIQAQERSDTGGEDDVLGVVPHSHQFGNFKTSKLRVGTKCSYVPCAIPCSSTNSYARTNSRLIFIRKVQSENSRRKLPLTTQPAYSAPVDQCRSDLFIA